MIFKILKKLGSTYVLRGIVGLFSLVYSFTALAWDVKVNGIAYSVDEYSSSASVVYDVYHQDLTELNIVPEVTYKGKTYPVTEIEGGAFKNCTNAQKVTIPEGIKSIRGSSYSGGAFESCAGLKEIKLPNSLEEIECYVFYGCTGLTKLTIPYNVQDFESDALDGCSNLKTISWNSRRCKGGIGRVDSLQKIVFGDGVEYISAYFCNDCQNLSSIIVSDSVKEIGEKAFENTPWENNQPDGVVYAGKVAYVYKGTAPTKIVLKDGTVGIGDAFMEDQKSLKQVIIPNSCTHIGRESFRNCTALSGNIPLNKNVVYLGENAFYGCSGLTGTLTIPAALTSIEAGVFYGCSGLNGTLSIHSKVTHLGKDAFYGCSFSSLIYDAEEATFATHSTDWLGATIPGTNAFNCPAITSLTFGEHVKKIPYGFGSMRFREVVVPAGVEYIEANALSCSYLQTVTWKPQKCTSSGGPFYGCDNLTTFNFADNIEEIPYALLCGVRHLESIKIPNTVNAIGARAFEDCESLKSIVIPEKVTLIQYSTFGGCASLTTVTIPEQITHISAGAFSNCGSLKTVYYNAIECETEAFNNGSGHYSSDEIFENAPIENLIFGKKVKNLPVRFMADSKLKRVIITAPIETLPSRCFYRCRDLMSVEMPSSVTTIGYEAFFWCEHMEKVTIPSSVETIGESAFSYCTGLKSVTNYAETPQSIDSKCFYNVNTESCYLYVPAGSIEKYKIAYGWKDFIIDSHKWKYTKNSINAITVTGYEGVMPSTLTIPASIDGLPVTSIGESAFEGCTILTSVTIPNSVTSIGNKAFRKCSNLKTANIPSSVTSIGSAAFSNCTALTTVSIPDKVTKINNSTFYNCNSLKSIAIPNSVTSIGDSAFELCSGLTSATIPNSVKSLGRYAFYKCSGLKSVKISNSVTEIGRSAFNACTSLTSATIPNSVVTVGELAFYGCSNLASVTLSDKLSKVSNYTFYHCTSLKSVKIPDSVVAVDSCAFTGCSALSSLTIGNSVKKFDYCAFSNCTSLKTVVIPGSVTEIGRSAFYNCSGLKSVEIPNSAKTIGLYAFSGCSNLSSVTNHATTPQAINANVFTGVDKTKCKLNVWHESVNKYKKAEVWKDFLINDLGGVEGVEADTAAKEVEGYYDLRGVRLAEPSRGQAVIVRYTDGTASKIIVK